MEFELEKMTAAPPNKVPVRASRCFQIGGVDVVEQSLAGCGGEEELLSCLLMVLVFFSLPCRGGEGGRRSEAAAPASIWTSTIPHLELTSGCRCRLTPRRCR